MLRMTSDAPSTSDFRCTSRLDATSDAYLRWARLPMRPRRTTSDALNVMLILHQGLPCLSWILASGLPTYPIYPACPAPYTHSLCQRALLCSSRRPLMLSSGLHWRGQRPTLALMQSKGSYRSAIAGKAIMGSAGEMMPRDDEDFS
jgi:hypothetical protein